MLGTANALDANTINTSTVNAQTTFSGIGQVNQIGSGAGGETAGLLPPGRLMAELQWQTDAPKGKLQPTAGLLVGLAAAARRIRPHQGVTEIATMQHSSPAARTPHQIQAPSLGQGQPMALQGPLVQTERQGGAPPPSDKALGLVFAD